MSSSAPHLIYGSPVAAIAAAREEHILAWANDCATGAPVHISQLRRSQKGLKCGCRCPACGDRLDAYNAGRTDYERRPHFRHLKGARQRNDCAILAARHAALMLLGQHGLIDLPGKTVCEQMVGASGRSYTGEIKLPPYAASVVGRSYVDQATAVLAMDDGTSVHVVLTGAVGDITCVRDAEGNPVPTIFLELSDPALAALDPEHLLEQLRLQPDIFCWRHHPGEIGAKGAALEEAKKQAIESLDYMEGLEGVPRALLAETILHLTAKQILASSESLALPAHTVEVSSVSGSAAVSRGATIPVHTATTQHWQLERREGNLIPDASCIADVVEARAPEPLRVEITVANPLDDERREKIVASKVATLEIDLRRHFGRVSRTQLREILLENTMGKRWLMHPAEANLRESLLAEAAAEATTRDQKTGLVDCHQLDPQTTTAESAAEDWTAVDSESLLAEDAAEAAIYCDWRQSELAECDQLESPTSPGKAGSAVGQRGACNSEPHGDYGLRWTTVAMRTDLPRRLRDWKARYRATRIDCEDVLRQAEAARSAGVAWQSVVSRLGEQHRLYGDRKPLIALLVTAGLLVGSHESLQRFLPK